MKRTPEFDTDCRRARPETGMSTMRATEQTAPSVRSKIAAKRSRVERPAANGERVRS